MPDRRDDMIDAILDWASGAVWAGIILAAGIWLMAVAVVVWLGPFAMAGWIIERLFG